MRLIDERIFRTFQASHVQTTLSKNVSYVYLNEDPYSALARLSEGNFDYAPVCLDRFDSTIQGWVAGSNLLKFSEISGSMHKLSDSSIISRESSFTDLLKHLSESPFVFLVGKGGIEGFVVPTDLDKHASRSHFYLLVCGLELILSEIVEREHKRERIEQEIDRGDDKQRAKFVAAKQQNIDTSPVSYLYLSSLIRLISSLPRFHDVIGISKLEWKGKTSLLLGIRNAVMHSNLVLTKDHTTEILAGVADFVETLISNLSQTYLSEQ